MTKLFAFVCGYAFGSSCPAGHLPIPNMRWWKLYHALGLAFLDWSLAEAADWPAFVASLIISDFSLWKHPSGQSDPIHVGNSRSASLKRYEEVNAHHLAWNCPETTLGQRKVAETCSDDPSPVVLLQDPKPQMNDQLRCDNLVCLRFPGFKMC